MTATIALLAKLNATANRQEKALQATREQIAELERLRDNVSTPPKTDKK